MGKPVKAHPETRLAELPWRLSVLIFSFLCTLFMDGLEIIHFAVILGGCALMFFVACLLERERR